MWTLSPPGSGTLKKLMSVWSVQTNERLSNSNPRESESLDGLLKHQTAGCDSMRLGWCWGIRTPNKFPNDVDAVGPGTNSIDIETTDVRGGKCALAFILVPANGHERR